MAPIAFTFNGIKIYIYPDDHLPIHIHAVYAEYETVYELLLDAGKLVDISIRKGSPNPIPPAQHKKVIKFLKKHYKIVINQWTELVVLKKQIKIKRISGL